MSIALQFAEAVPALGHGSVFNGLDWAVIAFFGIGMIVTVLVAMRKKNESGKDYFLSGRDANWLVPDRPMPVMLL